MTSTTSIAIDFARKEMVILGTQYAGEMKKGVFTVMHYMMPKQVCLIIHAFILIFRVSCLCILVRTKEKKEMFHYSLDCLVLVRIT